jgi:hypothetical protein
MHRRIPAAGVFQRFARTVVLSTVAILCQLLCLAPALAVSPDISDPSAARDELPSLSSMAAPMQASQMQAMQLSARTAAPPRKRHRWVWDSLLALRYNPRGAIARVRAGYRLQLWDRPGILFERSFASLKAAVDITPAYARVGGVLELQPLAALRLWARYDHVASFGAFSYTQSFDDPRRDHSDSAVQALSDSDYATKGEQLTVGTLLQMKVGDFAARSQLEAMHGSFDLRPGHRVFYDGYLDTLFPNGGWGLVNDSDLLYLHDSGFKLMLRYTYNHVLYRADHYAELAAPMLHSAGVANSPTHRLGPVLLYTFLEDGSGTHYDAPTVAFLAQWWIRHRYRTGADTAAAMPFMLLVLLQRGDLF